MVKVKVRILPRRSRRRPDFAHTGQGGFIQVAEGKSKAVRRLLPMAPEVYRALKARHEAQGSPTEVCAFPTGSDSGHMEESSAKKWHAKALAVSGVKPFEPYCLRHTALTWLLPHCDAFTLARIAGHSSITITQRYCHPQADPVEAAFQKMASRRELVTEGGHLENLLPGSVEAKEAVTLPLSES